MISADITNLDREYDLRAAFPDYVEYFGDWRSRSMVARTQLPCRLDVPYGSGAREQIDLFPAVSANGGSGRPLIAFIHGGYWRSMDKSDFSFLAIPFVKRGISLAFINYALFPGTTMSEVVSQVRRACLWLTHYCHEQGIPFDDLHIAGWSAGAHLGSMVVSTETDRLQSNSPDIASLIAVSGVYDLRPILRTSANSDLQLNLAEVERNSPIDLSPPRLACPIVVAWGAEETAAFRAQSKAFAASWREKDADVRELQIPGLHHYAAMDALADERSTLFSMAIQLIRRAAE